LATFDNALNIFADGSSRSSPRRGGIGVIFVIIGSSGEEQVQHFDFPGYKNATSNEMELQACIMGLKEAMKMELPPNFTRVVIQTDSSYVADHYKKAMFQWSKNNWLALSGRPILNPELWKELVKCIQKMLMPVEIRWVKGHSKNEHNKAADRLARQSSMIALKAPITHVSVRRKIRDKSVEIGSVEMNGQRITIRIITSERLRVQRLWKYKYEVMSRQSKFRGNVDIIFSEHHIRDGHTYYVRVNTDTSNPRIEKVFREIDPKSEND